MAADKRGRKLPKGIRKRSASTYEGRFMYQGETYTVHAKTITETQKLMNDVKYELEHGFYTAAGKITFEEWFNIWMQQYKKNTVKAGTYESYKYYYSMAVKDQIGRKRLENLRSEHIQKIYNDMAEEGYKLASVKGVSAMLKGCFSQAVKNRLIAYNPMNAVELPRCEPKKKRVALTKEQQDLFLEYAKQSSYYSFFKLLLLTGMRNGELRGLKYSDVDKKENVIHVRRTIKYIKGAGMIEDTPKSKSSERDIPIRSDILKLLREQRNLNESCGIKAIDGYFFQGSIPGSPISAPAVTVAIKKIVEQIQDDGYEFPEITAHSLRHTFATRAIEAGMQPQTLKTILGHSSLNMTMDLYSHVMPTTKQEEMEKIANAFI